MKEALFYQKKENSSVQCLLCPHTCVIQAGKAGFCLSRQNHDGSLFALDYGIISSANIDPIEKKPLFHFYPGQPIFSIGSFGCSFACSFCQNYTISRTPPESSHLVTPEECVQAALQSGSKMLAFTYNEPYINYEYLLETSRLAREKGLRNVLVTNGYYQQDPWEKLAPYIDAMNIDLKGDNSFYQQECKGQVQPVLDTIRSAYQKNIHLEITHLIVTHKNDNPASLDFIINFIASISKDIPLHFSRYFPRFKLNEPPTSEEILTYAYQQARKKLNYVYLGNILLDSTEDTFCPNCKTLLIQRKTYQIVIAKNFKHGICPNCQLSIPGYF